MTKKLFSPFGDFSTKQEKTKNEKQICAFLHGQRKVSLI